MSVHLVPALLGGLVGVLLAGLAEDKSGPLSFKIGLYQLYPARAHPAGPGRGPSPLCSASNLSLTQLNSCPYTGDEIHAHFPELFPVLAQSRTSGEQAAWQAAAIGITAALALVAGLIAGGVLKVTHRSV